MTPLAGVRSQIFEGLDDPSLRSGADRKQTAGPRSAGPLSRLKEDKRLLELLGSGRGSDSVVVGGKFAVRVPISSTSYRRMSPMEQDSLTAAAAAVGWPIARWPRAAANSH